MNETAPPLIVFTLSTILVVVRTISIICDIRNDQYSGTEKESEDNYHE